MSLKSLPALKVSFFFSHLPVFRFFVSPDPRSEPIRLQNIECLLSLSRSLAIVLEILKITLEQLCQQLTNNFIIVFTGPYFGHDLCPIIFQQKYLLYSLSITFLGLTPGLAACSLLAMSLIKYWIVSLLVWWFSLIYFPQDFLWTFFQMWHLLQTILQFMWSGSHRIMSLERCVMLQWTASLDLVTSTACHADIIHPAEGK